MQPQSFSAVRSWHVFSHWDLNSLYSLLGSLLQSKARRGLGLVKGGEGEGERERVYSRFQFKTIQLKLKSTGKGVN